MQRIHAVFFHEGAPALGDGALRTGDDLEALRAAAACYLSPAGQLQVAVALDMLAALEARLDVLRHRLLAAARHLTGARVLAARLYGVGPVTGLALTCWLAGAGRFSSARKAVRFAGLDVTVWSSDRKGLPGRLSRQGPPVLRWAVYEAGKTHARASAPATATTPRSRTARTASAPPCRSPQDPPPGLPHPGRARRRRADRRLSPASRPTVAILARPGRQRAGANLTGWGYNRGQLPTARCQPLPVLPRRARRTA